MILILALLAQAQIDTISESSVFILDAPSVDVNGEAEELDVVQLVFFDPKDTPGEDFPIANLYHPAQPGENEVPVSSVFSDLPEGFYYVYARLHDKAGNASAWSDGITVMVGDPQVDPNTELPSRPNNVRIELR